LGAAVVPCPKLRKIVKKGRRGGNEKQTVYDLWGKTSHQEKTGGKKESRVGPSPRIAEAGKPLQENAFVTEINRGDSGGRDVGGHIGAARPRFGMDLIKRGKGSLKQEFSRGVVPAKKFA